MTATPNPMPRELVARLTRACTTYREAFEEVERTLIEQGNAELPTWVFNLEAFDLDAIHAVSPAVASVERKRRAARTALHAVAEMIALDDPTASMATMPPDVTSGVDPESPEGVNQWVDKLSAKASEDLRWLRVLDRFIGIVGRADTGGALYVNGSFEPLATHDKGDVDITQVAERRKER